ncbi:MAG: transporter [Candidatus Rokubacteria bacterium]|nr:transporter [Candidatus Rokubacteria bacterium]
MKVDVVSINVLGSHVHLAGEWMLAYEYMLEDMDGNRDGTRRVSHPRVLQDFGTVPTNMSMEMHMATVMYAPSEDVTLMAMLPYLRKVMNHVTRSGVRFTERSEGIGDLQLRVLGTVYRLDRLEHRLLANAGLSLPAGSIDEKDFGSDRTKGKVRLEYDDQLGSGTVDLLPGLTYLGQSEDWAWGAEMIPTIRLGENSNHYRLGNRYRLSTWADRKWTDWLSVSGRIDGQLWENIHGADPTLDSAAAPTKDPKRRAGRRVDFLLGLNLYAPRGVLQGHRLAFEAGAPVYQSLDGPALQTDWVVRVGWQWVY